MAMKDNKNFDPVSQTTTLILSIVVAVVILAGIGLYFWVTSGKSGNGGEDVAQSTEVFPTIPSTFTPTSTPTPKSTPIPTATVTPTPSPTPTFTPTPIVVGWRELGYLTAAEFTSVTVTDFTRERKLLPDEKILLKAVGDIQISIDMSEIQDSDVEVNGTSVKIILPRAKVTSVELLPGGTEIFDNGWFPGEGLETAALDKARTELEQWANSNEKMLDLSEKLGKLQLETFLRQLGFQEITITFKNQKGI